MILKKDRLIWGILVLCGSASEIFSSSSKQPSHTITITADNPQDFCLFINMPIELIVQVGKKVFDQPFDPKNVISFFTTCKTFNSCKKTIINDDDTLVACAPYFFRHYTYFSSLTKTEKSLESALALDAAQWIKKNKMVEYLREKFNSCIAINKIITSNALESLTLYENDQNTQSYVTNWLLESAESNPILEQIRLALALRHRGAGGADSEFKIRSALEASTTPYFELLYKHCDKTLTWLLRHRPEWIPDASLWCVKNTEDLPSIFNQTLDYEECPPSCETLRKYRADKCTLVENALHTAAFTNNPDLAALLYTQEGVGEQFAQQYNSSGNLPLHTATYKRSTKVIDFLLKKGCSLDTVNAAGHNSCDIARESEAPQWFIDYLTSKKQAFSA